MNYDRPLAKPVSGTVQVWVNNVAITEGAGAGEFTVDTTTGIVTLGATLAAQSATDVEAACEFDVPVRFNLDKMAVTISFHDIYDWPVPVIEIRDIV